MDIPAVILEIRTLGNFSISFQGKTVATDWPDEASKMFFCSLLSPLDQLFTWDRICRSMWGVPQTRTSKRLLEETVIRTLKGFFTRELGFNPLITEHEGIRLDLKRIHLDALEFHQAVVEGLSLLSLGNHAEALEKFNRADALYGGSYLPGLPGKIIANTRSDLESLHTTLLRDGLRQASSLAAQAA